MPGCALSPFLHCCSFPRSGAQTFGGIGVRAEGMGGAFVAVADDASAVYWNPAGIATGSTFDFQISRVDAKPGRDFSSVRPFPLSA